MCKIVKKTKLKEFTGYKICRKINGKYYSAVTGIEYKIGEKVQPVEKIEDVDKSKISGYWLIDGIFGHLFNKDVIGFTNVFNNSINAAYYLSPKEDLVIMTLSGEIFETRMDNAECHMGNIIKDIRPI